MFVGKNNDVREISNKCSHLIARNCTELRARSFWLFSIYIDLKKSLIVNLFYFKLSLKICIYRELFTKIGVKIQ